MGRYSQGVKRIDEVLRGGRPPEAPRSPGDRRRQGAEFSLAQLTALLHYINSTGEDDGIASAAGGGGGNHPTIEGPAMLTDFSNKFAEQAGTWSAGGSGDSAYVQMDSDGPNDPAGLLEYVEPLVAGNALGDGYTDVEIQAQINNNGGGETGVGVHLNFAELHPDFLTDGLVWTINGAGLQKFTVWDDEGFTDVWTGAGAALGNGETLRLRIVENTYSLFRGDGTTLVHSDNTVGPQSGRCGLVQRDPGVNPRFSHVVIRNLEAASA